MIKCLTIIIALYALNVNAQEDILEQYVAKGLESNITLQQKKLDYQQSLKMLQKARSYYFPEISINARYSRADGGRTIDLPVGDMLNPVYTTLNQMLETSTFPQIENQQYNLLRNKEQETKIRLRQPLFNGDIYYNNHIKKQKTHYRKAERDAYKRNLINTIKEAYFNYLKATRLNDILNTTGNTLQENLRVNKKLYDNEKVTYDHVLKAKTAISKLEQKQASAKQKLARARNAFNFLLNRDLHAPIEQDIQYDTVINVIDQIDVKARAQKREELAQAKAAVQAMNYNHKRRQSAYWPDLSLIVDYGFQGKHYEFQKQQDFYIASIIFQWNIFQGMRRKAEIQKAIIEKKRSRLQQNKIKKQLEVEIINAYNALQTAYKQYLAACRKTVTTRSTWLMINKKYQEGMVSQLEHLDALNQYRIAQEEEAITCYNYHIEQANFEHAIAKIQINKK